MHALSAQPTHAVARNHCNGPPAHVRVQLRRSSIAVAVRKQKKIKRKVGPPVKPKPRVGKEAEAIEATPVYDVASAGTVEEWNTPEDISFVWEPAGLEPAQVLQYFESYPEEQVRLRPCAPSLELSCGLFVVPPFAPSCCRIQELQ